VLSCAERVEVRAFTSQQQGHPHPPTLEKVKAHDEDAVVASRRKAIANDRVDALTKDAAVGAVTPYKPDPRFVDVVQLQDASGAWILDVKFAVWRAQWETHRQEGAKRRIWLA
jgi:hypothetical protein